MFKKIVYYILCSLIITLTQYYFFATFVPIYILPNLILIISFYMISNKVGDFGMFVTLCGICMDLYQGQVFGKYALLLLLTLALSVPVKRFIPRSIFVYSLTVGLLMILFTSIYYQTFDKNVIFGGIYSSILFIVLSPILNYVFKKRSFI